LEDGFEISEVIPAAAAEIYNAWLSSEGHAQMTGSPALVDGRVGGSFSAWDGYITGSILELTPNRHIVQAWRTSEFPNEAPNSHLEIFLDEKNGQTTVILIHNNLPQAQLESYRQGWEDYYFKPMKNYFGGK